MIDLERIKQDAVRGMGASSADTLEMVAELERAQAERDTLRAEVKRLEDYIDNHSAVTADYIERLQRTQAERDELRRQLEQAGKRGVPEGWKLVPERMLLGADALESISAMCQDDETGEWLGAELRIGYVRDEEERWYGLAIGCTECLEEGYVTLLEFSPPATPVQPAVPEGWKLVPVEPTEEMIDEGVSAINEQWKVRAERVWEEMIAAAPVPPAQPADTAPDCQHCDQNVRYGSGFDASYAKGRAEGWDAAMQQVEERRGDALLVPHDVLLNLLAGSESHDCDSSDGECQVCMAEDAAADLLAWGDA